MEVGEAEEEHWRDFRMKTPPAMGAAATTMTEILTSMTVVRKRGG